MAKLIREYEILEDRFSKLSWLLSDFNSDISGLKKEKEIIAGFVKELKDPSQVQETLEQGRQFLALDELPIKWIRALSQRRPSLIEGNTKHVLEPTYENYYNWIKWMIEEVEREAKRQGKL
jgi:hypothetical protein